MPFPVAAFPMVRMGPAKRGDPSDDELAGVTLQRPPRPQLVPSALMEFPTQLLGREGAQTMAERMILERVGVGGEDRRQFALDLMAGRLLRQNFKPSR